MDAEQTKKIKALTRLKNARKAAEDLITFTQFTSPSSTDPDDSEISTYEIKRHHLALAAALEEVAKGKIKRLIVSMPPRHGKSELSTRKFIPWFVGKFPAKSIICACYGKDLAQDFGLEVKTLIDSPMYRQVFPDVVLSKGGKSQARLRTTKKGLAYFVGKNGSITGRGGDVIVVDDLFKNNEEADNPKLREKAWKWFCGTIMNRFMTDEGCLIIVMTRWHEDDIIGRLTDKQNPSYNEEIAHGFELINLPAEAMPDDLLGRHIGEALWPERFGLKFLREQKALNARSYSCLYQGNPTPETGTFFQRANFRYYAPGRTDLSRMRKFGVCDLSVGTKEQKRNTSDRLPDRSVLMIFAIDETDDIYIIDAQISRERSDIIVENMIGMMLTHKPITWFTYQDQITGSIGPFLMKRMKERRAYCHVQEHSSSGTKEQKAQSFRARTSMGKIYWPQGKAWAAEIIEELVAFPGGKNDDGVDACALIGQSMDSHISGSKLPVSEDHLPAVGTLAWVKYSSEREKQLKAQKENGGF